MRTPFRFRIAQVRNVRGRGTLAIGSVSSGTPAVGMAVDLIRTDGSTVAGKISAVEGSGVPGIRPFVANAVVISGPAAAELAPELVLRQR